MDGEYNLEPLPRSGMCDAGPHRRRYVKENSMNDRCLGILIVASACLAWSSPGEADAQASKAKPATTRCDTVLTRKESVDIVGATFEGPAFREPRPGFTSCDWQGPEANFGFTFLSTRALQADRQTAAEAFENDLAAVENDQQKREELPNIGLKAARVSLGDDAFLVEVQRADGVARMIFYKIADDKIIALARAVGSP
jgi:hypothetical protein